LTRGGILPPHSATLAINSSAYPEKVTPGGADDKLLAEVQGLRQQIRQQNELLAVGNSMAARGPAQTGIALGRTLNGQASRAAGRSAFAVRRPIA
jgi:hypothetical protein